MKPVMKPTKKSVLNPKRQIAVLPWRPAVEEGRVEVLLVTSRETRRWVIPKGWPMKGLASNMAAAREAYEEAGVQGYTAMDPIGTYLYDKRMAKGRPKRTEVVVYPFHVSLELDAWPEMFERERLWTTPEDAALKVDEPELKALILAFDPYFIQPRA
jgi:8-oxo-dGTP pyrophosphatase MutT (NUDIX family)